MKELIEVSSQAHSNVKVDTNSAIRFAEKLNVMNLRVNEVGHASTSFPVFFTRGNVDGRIGISAVTSLVSGSNLFVQGQDWTANYQPVCMRSYPFYLMRSAQGENNYTIGLDETDEVFSVQEGHEIFDSEKQATPYLHQVTKLLESDIKNDMQSYDFAKCIEEFGLLKSIDLHVMCKDNSSQVLKGLLTIDEDKLQELNAEQLIELNKKGYLSPIHAMLVSILQLNALIRLNNQRSSMLEISGVKLEITQSNNT